MPREPLRLLPLVVESPADVDAALLQLKLIAAVEQANKAELLSRTAAIADEIRAGQLVQVGRSKIPFADYKGSLTGELSAYCNAHRGELLPDEKVKSRKLTHGTIGWKKSTQKLADIDGCHETTLAKLLVASKKFGAGGLLNKVRSMLAELAINAAVAAADVFNVELKLDRERTLQLAIEGKLSAEWLGANNLKVVPARDEFDAKPNDLVVQTEPTNQAA